MKIAPKNRNKLKAKIFEAGFKTIQDFAVQAGTDPARASRIIGGWEFPSDCLSRSMAKALKISIDEFQILLG